MHTAGPMGKAMLTIMAAFAQLERDTHDRTHPCRFGHCCRQWPQGRTPPKVNDSDAAKARALKSKDVPVPDIAKILGCPVPRCTATLPSHRARNGTTTFVLNLVPTGTRQRGPPMQQNGLFMAVHPATLAEIARQPLQR
ncbi:hypothetical protein [Nocardia abscessus]|uniref:hypothetical protein n=1 Tax=Nocardia abscessus TaxID=120957 RepID=UPI001D13A044|nr:hypothetical protein [Nocardia abscessus]MCC3326609.1 hypothetical protein [Nocardia abscessus]